jgi:hypothetical protein
VSDVRPDRHALLELEALLGAIEALRDEGDAARFDRESRYRWVLHRLWIAVATRCSRTPPPPGSRYALTAPGRTYMTCATISPTPGSPTSTRDSPGGSPGPAWTRCEKRSGTIFAPLHNAASSLTLRPVSRWADSPPRPDSVPSALQHVPDLGWFQHFLAAPPPSLMIITSCKMCTSQPVLPQTRTSGSPLGAFLAWLICL